MPSDAELNLGINAAPLNQERVTGLLYLDPKENLFIF